MGGRGNRVTTRRDFLTATALGALCVTLASAAQKDKVWRFGLSGVADPTSYPRHLQRIHQGLRDFGYSEGKNFIVEYRWAEGRYERLLDLANELVRSKVDVIATHGTPGAQAA